MRPPFVKRLGTGQAVRGVKGKDMFYATAGSLRETEDVFGTIVNLVVGMEVRISRTVELVSKNNYESC